jgi:hypothetical protein
LSEQDEPRAAKKIRRATIGSIERVFGNGMSPLKRFQFCESNYSLLFGFSNKKAQAGLPPQSERLDPGSIHP